MGLTDSIVCIQDVLDRWRTLGSQRLENGIELIGRFPGVTPPAWTHVVFPGLSSQLLGGLESQLGVRFPSLLRAFYLRIGGLTMFSGAFRMAGGLHSGSRTGGDSLRPDSLVELNQELDVQGWKPDGAVAFAINSWDGSVHLAGMGRTPDEVVRCARTDGAILETHADPFECVACRFTRLDALLLE